MINQERSYILVYQAPIIGYCGGCSLPGFALHGFLGNDLDQVIKRLTADFKSSMPAKETKVSTLSENPWSIYSPLNSKEMDYLRAELSRNLPGLRFE